MANSDDDYMADLSLFLPPEATTTSSSSKKKPQPQPKLPKTLNWQQRRKLKQQEEDQQTLSKLESAIPESNLGFQMLKKMGYDPSRGGIGKLEPVGIDIRRSREGVGAKEEAERRGRVEEERKRVREEELVEEFEFRKKEKWRVRRIVRDFRKAEAVVAQLENVEVVEVEKDGEGEEKAVEEEEEEVVITEEDLHDILMNLRDKHRYCLYCGCQYESVEALQTDCPGMYEDDH